MARLDRLGDEPKRALQIASVIGREFALRLLERIHEAGEGLAPLLSELRTLELIYEKAMHPELAYMFKHALTHDVAYASVLSSRRKELHRIVGFAIEELYGERLAEHYETLAHHFSEGEELEKALFYHQRASEKAADAFANPAAADHCRRALALAERLGESVPRDVRRAAEGRLGHVLYLSSEFARSGEAYERAAALADEPAERTRDHARASYAFGWGHDYERAEASSDAGLASARAPGGEAGEGLVHLVRGFLHAIPGDLDRYEELVARGSSLARDHGETLALSGYLAGQIAEWRGDYRRALAECGLGAEVARKEGLPQFLAPAIWFQGKALCCLGEYGRSLGTLLEALDVAERIGSRGFQVRFLNTLGWLHAEIGSPARAADYNQRATSFARQMVDEGLVPGAPEIYGNAAINLAGNQLALGELGHAEAILAEIREQVDHETDPWLLWRYRLHLVDAEGRLALARGEPEAALRLAEHELADARARRLRKLEARALDLRAQALLGLDRRDDAGETLREALAAAVAIGYPPVRWRAHALAGELARRQGQRAAAEEAAARGRALVEGASRGLPEDLGRDLRALGERLATAPLGR